MKKSIFLSLVLILTMGGFANSLRTLATETETQTNPAGVDAYIDPQTCTHENVVYENLGLTHKGECEYCHEIMEEEAHVDVDGDMCCDACSSEISNLAPSQGEGYVESELTLNESIKISIAANESEVSKIIVSSWFNIDDERIYEAETTYNETTGLYEVEIRFDEVNGADGTYYFDAAIYDEASNMRYVRISEVEYTRNGISNVTTNRTPEGDIEVQIEAVEGGEIYIATDGEVPTEKSAWMPYTVARTYTVEDEGNSINEVQVYYKSSTIITEPAVESVGNVSWKTGTANEFIYEDEYGTFKYYKDSTSKYAKIILCTPKGEAVEFPSEIDGLSVIEIGHTNTSYNIFGTSSNSTVKEISLPETLGIIGKKAFGSCIALNGKLLIPNSVTSIGDSAFSGCSRFTGSLEIPNNVTSIGSSAFYGCSGFTGSLVIPNSVTSIGSSAFYRCSGFTGNLIIPDSVIYIGRSAFSYCSGFNGILTIGKSVISMGDETFHVCDGFTYIDVNELNSTYKDIEGILFNKEGTNLIKAPAGMKRENYIIPSTVIRIESGAFYRCSGFTGNLVISNSVTSIGDSAFYGCSKFTGSLTIGTSVTSIGSYAFQNCSGFTGSLEIPESVTSIGSYAFQNCSGFTGSLTIGNSVTSIGSYVFQNCSGFTGSLEIPNSVTSIGSYAFQSCSGFTGSLTIGSGVTSIGSYAFQNCSGFTGSLTIGNSVTSIGNHAFFSCSGFTGSLEIPNSVTRIERSTFYECRGFTGSLTIGNSVTSIESSAFYGCSGFTGSLEIPNSITSIGNHVFNECSGFTGILTIGSGVTSIGGSAFNGCSGFTGSLEIPESVTSIESYAFQNCSGFSGSLEIPDSVTSIGQYAFYGCSGFSGSLTIGNSITSIGRNAFYNCSGFTGSLVIPNSVTSIEYNSFVGCKNIDYIIIASSTLVNKHTSSSLIFDNNKIYALTSELAESYKVNYWNKENNGNGVYPVLQLIRTIPEELTQNSNFLDSGVTVAGFLEDPSGLFKVVKSYRNSSGIEVNEIDTSIIDTYTAIYTLQMKNASGEYENVKNSSGDEELTRTIKVIEKIEYESAVNVTWQTGTSNEFTYDNEYGTFKYYKDSTSKYAKIILCTPKGETVEFPTDIDGLRVIEIGHTNTSYNIFGTSSNSTVKEISLPETLGRIGKKAFGSCIALNGKLLIPNSVTNIGDSAFSGCSRFTGSLVIPDSVTGIGDYAFEKCSGFNGNLTIGNSVTNIGLHAFLGCSGFTGNLIIPDSVIYIGYSAFSGCSRFTGSLVLSNSLKSILNEVFYKCSGFTGNLIIPESVTRIVNNAFDGMDGLTYIEVEENNTQYKDIDGILFNKEGTNLIKAPAGMKRENYIIPSTVIKIENYAFYKCSGFSGSLTIGDSVTDIGEYAFSECRGFSRNLTLGNSVTNIGKYAFSECRGFSGSLIIPNSIKKIDIWAFKNCSSFSGSLIIEEGATNIGGSTFYGCSGFTGSLEIPSSITSIESETFYNCSGFSGSLKIPNSITSIGNYAFSGCSGFTGNLIIPNSVTSIGSFAFSGCSGLTGSLTIPDSVTSIGSSAFYECSGFTGNLIIPNSVTSIGSSAFSECSGLTGSLTIPNSVTSIEKNVFYKCSGFSGSLTIGNSVTSIGDSAFEGCSGFNGNLILSNSVTSIGSLAFSGCSGFIGNLIIPDSVTSIGNYAFSGCSGFNGSLTIPNSVTSIGYSAFSGCSSFNGNLILPNNLTSIGYSAFLSCSNLKYSLLTDSALTSIHTSSSRSFDNGKVYALTSELAESYKVNYWNKENDGKGVYPALQLFKTIPEKVKSNSNFIDYGASVCGLFEDPTGLLKIKKSYKRIDDVAVASLDGVRFAEGDEGSATLDTSVTGTYEATYTLQMLSGDSYVDVTNSNGDLEQVTREIIVVDAEPEVSDILVLSPNNGEHGIDTQITFNVVWNKEVNVEEAPVLTIKFSGDGEEIEATYVKTEGNISTYTYKLTKDDVGYLELVGYANGIVNDTEGREWASSEVTFDDEIYATGKRDQKYMVTEWTIPADNTEIILPVTGPVNLKVDWGDGTTSGDVTTEFPRHTYAEAGVYDITISGFLTFWGDYTEGKKENYATYEEYITGLKQWGELYAGIYSFNRCKNLKYVSGDHTENTFKDLYNMQCMFAGCSSLTSIDLSYIDTSKVGSMYALFSMCTSLTSINVTGWNTSKVTNMYNMFTGCTSLKSLDISSFDTSNVTTMRSMFGSCWNLETLIFNKETFKTSKVTTMQYMFSECEKLTSLDVSKFDTLNVTHFGAMFYNCMKIKELDVSNFNTSKAQYMNSMFNGCSALEEIDVKNFDTSNVIDLNAMFMGCKLLTEIDVASWNTEKVTNFNRLFSNCENLNNINVTNFNTSSATSMTTMFYNCKSLTLIDVSNFDTSKVTEMASVFGGCQKLIKIDISHFDTSNVTYMNGMFENSGISSILVGNKFIINNSANVTNMFTNASNLTKILVTSSTPSGDQFGKVADQVQNVTFYVPNQGFESYLNTWSNSIAIEPIIKLNGNNKMTISLNSTYEDPGYTVIGETTEKALEILPTNYGSKTAGTVDTKNEGTYEIKYQVIKTSGDVKVATNGDVNLNEELIAEETRTVTVEDASKYMVTEWTIPSDNTEIILPVTGNVNLTIDWGDGNISGDVITELPTHTYGEAGTYDITIYGTCGRWGSNYIGDNIVIEDTTYYTYTQYLTGLKQWGELGVTRYGFTYCENLKYVSGDVTENTFKNVNDMKWMFGACNTLERIDLSNFDTSKVTDMQYMFDNCYKLTTLNISSFDTSFVTNMHGMFFGCSALETLDLSNFNTSNVTAMSGMFYECISLKSIDLSSFDTSKVTTMYQIFLRCEKLKSLDLSNFDTSNVNNMLNMFYKCYALESVNLSSFNTSKVTNMKGMFNNCESLLSLDLSNFDTSNVTNMRAMFSICTSLEDLDISNFDLSNVTETYGMFNKCYKLKSLDITNFDTSKVTDMSYMFRYCESLPSILVSNKFIINQGTTTTDMFTGTTNLSAIIITDNTPTVDQFAPVASQVSNITFYVSNGSEASYRDAWSLADEKIQPILQLVGENEIILLNDEGYEDAKYEVAGFGLDKTDAYTVYGYNVKGSGTVNPDVEGTYQITYKLNRNNSHIATVTRTVIIGTDLVITAMQNANVYDGNWTNEKVTLVPSYKGNVNVTAYEYKVSGDSDWSEITTDEIYINQNFVGQIIMRGLNPSGKVVTGEAVSNIVKFDNVIPEVLTASSKTIEKTLIINVSASDDYSGLMSYAITLSENEAKAWQDIIDETGEIEIATLGSGTYNIFVKDKAGNVSNAKTIVTEKDIIAPSGDITVVEAYTKEENIEYTNENPVTLEITASDDVTANENLKMAILREEEYNALTDEEQVTWESFSSSKPFTILKENDDEIIYLLLKDEAGNVSTQIGELKPTNVEYKVKYYVRNVNDTAYELYREVSKSTAPSRTINLANERIAIGGTSYEKASLTENGASEETVKIAADGTTEIYLYYTRNTYELTLETGENIASVEGEGTYTYGETVTISANLQETAGYTTKFAMWRSKNVGLVEDKEENSVSFEMPAESVTLEATAEKEANTYEITLNPTGGTVSEPTVNVTYGNGYGKLPEPTQEYATFKGWYTETGEEITETYANKTPENHTIYAKWEYDPIAIYTAADTTLRFIKPTERIEIGSDYNGKEVTGVYRGIETTQYKADLGNGEIDVPWLEYAEDILEVTIEDKISPISTAAWFGMFVNVTSIDLSNLDTSNVTDMTAMFYGCSRIASLDVSSLDTSKVKSMSYMFLEFASETSTFEIIGINNLETSRVENMSGMFLGAGACTSAFELNLSNWDTSNVTNMNEMFVSVAQEASNFKLNLSNWNTSNVQYMGMMFYGSGYNATSYEIIGLNDWDTSSVTNMSNMFTIVANNADSFILDLSNWNLSNVKNMTYMFYMLGENADVVQLNLSNWKMSKVTDMNSMFYETGIYANTLKLDLSNWDTSNVTNMSEMFYNVGYSASTLELNLNNWNTSNVTNMRGMFSCVGLGGSLYSLDLSSFDTSSITNMDDMFFGCSNLQEITLGEKFEFIGEYGYLPPPHPNYIEDADGKWYNIETNQGYTPAELAANHSGLATYSAIGPQAIAIYSETDDSLRFYKTKEKIEVGSIYNDRTVTALYKGIEQQQYESREESLKNNVPWYEYAENTLIIKIEDEISPISTVDWFYGFEFATNIDVNNLNTSKVTDMRYMFFYTGNRANTFEIIGLDDFDTSSVKDMSYMFHYAGCNSSTISIGNLSNWDTSNVKNMSAMFLGMGYSAEELRLDLSNWNTSSVTNMSMMFYRCRKIKTLDLSSFDTSNVESMSHMFYLMDNLEEITLGPKFNFVGTDGYLPAQTSTNISGANGKWYDNETEIGYEPANVPSSTAATYSAIGRYTVTFDTLGGTEIAPVTAIYGTALTVPENPTKEEHIFIGWDKEIPATITEDITITAKWEVKIDLIPSIANAPVLGEGMKAVYWTGEDGTGETIANEHTESMYNYTIGNGKDDTKNSKWANAITVDDGSYWVWIPRYAYKIVYTNEDKSSKFGQTTSTVAIAGEKTEYGNIDILFMYGKSGDYYRDENENPVPLPDGYKVHPAFQKMTTEQDLATNPLGKWDEELEGIWVAKYEASQGSTGKVESKPSVKNWNNIAESKIYINSLNMHPELNSHEMKNSEWGAVSYLTQSAYGRNGNEIAINQCSSYYTGAGQGKNNSSYSYNESTFEKEYAWNTARGKLASTTGNIYGIYDMAGGAYEYVASYLDNGHDYLTNTSYGKELGLSTDLKTKQIYASQGTGGTSDRSIDYEKNKEIYGDAIYETSTSYTGNTSWNNDDSYYPYSEYVFFKRGGVFSSINNDIFYFSNNTGFSNDQYGFRPVLCVGEEEISHKVTFNADGGKIEGLDLEETTRWVIEGKKYGEISEGLPTAEKDNYTFLGWFTIDGEQITADTIVDETAEGLIVYAHWELKTYEVRFEANGGNVDGLGSTYTTRFVTYGKTYGEVAAGFPEAVRDGYNFLGWFTSGDSETLVSGDTVVDETAEGLILYAKWEALIEAKAVYSETDNSLTFYKNSDTIIEGETYNEKIATVVYTGFETATSSVPWNENRANITTVVIQDEITPISTANWFREFKNTTSLDLAKLNTSSVTNMSHMFYLTGDNVSTFEIRGLNNWNTLSVTDMSYMFGGAGSHASSWSIGDLSKWNTSNVTTMESMFSLTGFNEDAWSVGDISGWKISRVTNMAEMFAHAGASSNTFDLNLSSWDTSNVTNMKAMFCYAGMHSNIFKLNLSGWDTLNVINMEAMFYETGYNSNTFDIGDLSNWNTSSVTNMEMMFYEAGYNAEPFALNISGFDTSKVTKMTDMFGEMRKLQEITLGSKFSFTGNGNTYCKLPTPSYQNIPGTDGRWHNLATQQSYEVEDVPSNTAATYTAIKPEWACCFVEGTQIMTTLDGKTKSIEEFKAGDKVVSYNIETGEKYLAEVQRLIINPKPLNMARVYLKDGSMVDMTDYHPLYTKEGFHSITNKDGYETLVEGDIVKTTNGWSEIIKIELYQTKPMNVYNLAIKDYDEIIDDDTNDTYYANGMVVHNADCEQ